METKGESSMLLDHYYESNIDQQSGMWNSFKAKQFLMGRPVQYLSFVNYALTSYLKSFPSAKLQRFAPIVVFSVI